MAKIMTCVISCGCEQGVMFKTTLKDRQGNPAMFSLEYGFSETDFFEYTLLVFEGYCSTCGKSFRYQLLLDAMLFYNKPIQ